MQACRALYAELQSTAASIDNVDEEMLNAYMSLNDIAAPDLFIRTGGEQRISNFLIWQLAYTELYFVDTLWPDFSDEDFSSALNWYSNRQRRFGKTGQQIAEQTV